jgi:cell division protein ZapA
LKEPVKVKILDTEYLIRSDESSEEVQRIAAFVNEKFQEITEGRSGLSDKMTAILAAFHIASDYFQLAKEREAILQGMKRRTDALIQHIDATMR